MQLYTVLYDWGTCGGRTGQPEPAGFGQSSCRTGAGSASYSREDELTNTLLTSQETRPPHGPELETRLAAYFADHNRSLSDVRSSDALASLAQGSDG
jgi:hypothetical protein